MKEIQFTQYLMPDGRKRSITLDMPDEVPDLATKLVEAGVQFEAEMLMTGAVSLTAAMMVDGEMQDVAIKLVENGPKVPEAVGELVRLAWAAANKDGNRL